MKKTVLAAFGFCVLSVMIFNAQSQTGVRIKIAMGNTMVYAVMHTKEI
jgi:hypothetical protein